MGSRGRRRSRDAGDVTLGSMLDGLLKSIDGYLDAVPRPATRVEEIGPFTLFVNEGIGWRYYARPTVGATRFTSSDVQVVLDRQRELDQPLEFEWLVGITPGVGPATESAGLRAVERPLMHLPTEDFRPHPVPEGALVRFVEPGDDLAAISAVAMVGFDSPGTGHRAPGPGVFRGSTTVYLMKTERGWVVVTESTTMT